MAEDAADIAEDAAASVVSASATALETEDAYSVAGRIMAMRNSGMFMDLMDSSGKIQIFCHHKEQHELLYRDILI